LFLISLGTPIIMAKSIWIYSTAAKIGIKTRLSS